jgi:hypothetical protein
LLEVVVSRIRPTSYSELAFNEERRILCAGQASKEGEKEGENPMGGKEDMGKYMSGG